MMKNIKRLLVLMLTCTLSVSCIAGGCKKDKENGNSGGNEMVDYVTLWGAPSTKKIVINEDPLQSARPEVNISMVKNENESAQLVITPSKNITYDLKVSDLKCGEKVIPAKNIKLYREHYLYLTHSGNPSMTPNYYPDALIPFEKSKAKGENKVRKDQNQPVWIEVTTEKDTASGNYQGEITVTIDGTGEIKVPLNVKVADVTLPDENHAKSAYAIWEEGNFLHGYFDDTQDYYKIYYDYLLDHRVSGTFIPGTQHTLDSTTKVTDLVEAVKKYALNEKVSAYCLPYTRTTVHDDEHEVDHSYFDVDKLERIMTELVKASTNEENYLDKAYIYFDFCDEPDVSQAWRIAKTDLEFYKLKERIYNNGLLYPADGSKDMVRESIKKIHHVATVSDQEHYYPLDKEGNYVGGAETFCPIFSELQSTSMMNDYLYRKEHGLTSWFYGCVHPSAPYPTFHMDDRGVSPRMVGWLQKYYDIEGELYWVTNLTQRFNLDLWRYFSIDPWTSAYTGWVAPGDGMILYPGKKYDVNGPIPSLRMKHCEDSKEDYELLLLLENALTKASETYKTEFEFASYVKTLMDTLFNGFVITDKNNNFDNVRNEIIALIELLNKDSEIVVKVEKSNSSGKALIEVYSKNDIKLNADGKDIAYSENYLKEDGKYLYKFDYYMVSGANYCNLKFTENGKEYHFTRYIGTSSKVFRTFNDKKDVELTGKTDGAKEFHGVMGEPKNDTEISYNVNPEFATSGGSLKFHYKGVPDNPTYKPGIKLFNDGKTHSYPNLGKVTCDIYNQNWDFKIYLLVEAQLNGSTKTKSVVTDSVDIHHGYNKVELSANVPENYDMSKIVSIELLTENPIYTNEEGVLTAGGDRTMYFDNIMFEDRVKGLQEVITYRDVKIEKDDFDGLYDEIPNAMGRPVTAEGLAIDFEDFSEDVQPYATFMNFEGIKAKMSINNDKNYVTHGNGSLKVECKTNEARNVEIWFNMPYDATNFIDKNQSISLDIINPMGVELDYVFTTSKDKGGATYQLEKSIISPNSTKHLTFDLHEKLDPHDPNTAYDDRDNVAIWIISLRLPPQSDITLYFDNFVVTRLKKG